MNSKQRRKRTEQLYQQMCAIELSNKPTENRIRFYKKELKKWEKLDKYTKRNTPKPVDPRNRITQSRPTKTIENVEGV